VPDRVQAERNAVGAEQFLAAVQIELALRLADDDVIGCGQLVAARLGGGREQRCAEQCQRQSGAAELY
jgi:hypothetical protein